MAATRRVVLRRAWPAFAVWPRLCDSWARRRRRLLRPLLRCCRRRGRSAGFSVCPWPHCTAAVRAGRTSPVSARSVPATVAAPSRVCAGTGCRTPPSTGAARSGRHRRSWPRAPWTAVRPPRNRTTTWRPASGWDRTVGRPRCNRCCWSAGPVGGKKKNVTLRLY